MRILLPVCAIKRRYCQRYDRFGLQAIGVDANAVRVGAWHIERFDAAMPAKIVPRDFGIKCVSLEVVFASHETKILLRHDHVQVTRLATNAAIALICFNISRRVDFKTHTTTMTSAFMCWHH